MVMGWGVGDSLLDIYSYRNNKEKQQNAIGTSPIRHYSIGNSCTPLKPNIVEKTRRVVTKGIIHILYNTSI
jgi:hypothetical protein